jgi:hypothetical protein
MTEDFKKIDRIIVKAMVEYQIANRIKDSCVSNSLVVYDFMNMLGYNAKLKTGILEGFRVGENDEIEHIIVAHCWAEVQGQIKDYSLQWAFLDNKKYYTLTEFIKKARKEWKSAKEMYVYDKKYTDINDYLKEMILCETKLKKLSKDLMNDVHSIPANKKDVYARQSGFVIYKLKQHNINPLKNHKQTILSKEEYEERSGNKISQMEYDEVVKKYSG